MAISNNNFYHFTDDDGTTIYNYNGDGPGVTDDNGGSITWHTSTGTGLTERILKCSNCKKKIGRIKTTFEPEEVICETCRKIEKLIE